MNTEFATAFNKQTHINMIREAHRQGLCTEAEMNESVEEIKSQEWVDGAPHTWVMLTGPHRTEVKLFGDGRMELVD